MYVFIIEKMATGSPRRCMFTLLTNCVCLLLSFFMMISWIGWKDFPDNFNKPAGCARLSARRHGATMSSSLPSDWIPFEQLQSLCHPLIVTTINCGYAHFADNLWLSYASMNMTDHLLYVAEDKAALAHLMRAYGSRHVVLFPNSTAKSAASDYNTHGFNRVAARRIKYLQWFLQHGISVIYHDSDIVFYQDPFSFLPGKGYDVVLTTDAPDDTKHPYGARAKACSCFIYIHPTEPAMKLLEAWQAHTFLPGRTHQDQVALNDALRTFRINQSYTDVKILMLPAYLFPSGAHARAAAATAVWYHANWMVGPERKKAALQARGLWRTTMSPLQC